MRIKRSPLDAKFSTYIRTRDKWTCQKCGTYYLKGQRKGLHASHFHGRRKGYTRFDPDNCDALCFGCHQHFGENHELYANWKRFRLGHKRFNLLAIRARHTKPDYKLDKIWLDVAMKKQVKEGRRQ